MIVYVDLIFLLNLLIDSVLLVLTGWSVKASIRPRRLLAAAVLGAAYVVLMLYPHLSILLTFAAKLLVSAGMVLIAFGFGTPKRFVRTLCAFYLVNFAVAGGMFGLYYMLLSSNDVLKSVLVSQSGGIGFQFETGLAFVAAAFLLAAAFYVRQMRSKDRREKVASFLADVSIRIGSFFHQCTGLIDTGNHLYDPLTKSPVLIVEAERFKEVLPEAWLAKIRRLEVDQLLTAIGDDSFPWPDRLRIVPYRGVGRGTQFMLAVKPDLVTVRYQDRNIEAKRVLIGFDGGRLSADGSYGAILHPSLFGDAL